jgi:hypothetical protein
MYWSHHFDIWIDKSRARRCETLARMGIIANVCPLTANIMPARRDDVGIEMTVCGSSAQPVRTHHHSRWSVPGAARRSVLSVIAASESWTRAAEYGYYEADTSGGTKWSVSPSSQECLLSASRPWPRPAWPNRPARPSLRRLGAELDLHPRIPSQDRLIPRRGLAGHPQT